MRLELTEDAKRFINTLNEAELANATFTENTMESEDPAITAKFEKYVKDRFEAMGEKVRFATEQFKAEHPEYFD